MATKKNVDLLRHMLGVDPRTNQKHWGYRNYFAAGEDSVPECNALVSEGLAVCDFERYGLVYFSATKAGMEVAGLSPRKINVLMAEQEQKTGKARE